VALAYSTRMTSLPLGTVRYFPFLGPTLPSAQHELSARLFVFGALVEYDLGGGSSSIISAEDFQHVGLRRLCGTARSSSLQESPLRAAALPGKPTAVPEKDYFPVLRPWSAAVEALRADKDAQFRPRRSGIRYSPNTVEANRLLMKAASGR